MQHGMMRGRTKTQPTFLQSELSLMPRTISDTDSCPVDKTLEHQNDVRCGKELKLSILTKGHEY